MYMAIYKAVVHSNIVLVMQSTWSFYIDSRFTEYDQFPNLSLQPCKRPFSKATVHSNKVQNRVKYIVHSHFTLIAVLHIYIVNAE